MRKILGSLVIVFNVSCISFAAKIAVGPSPDLYPHNATLLTTGEDGNVNPDQERGNEPNKAVLLTNDQKATRDKLTQFIDTVIEEFMKDSDPHKKEYIDALNALREGLTHHFISKQLSDKVLDTEFHFPTYTLSINPSYIDPWLQRASRSSTHRYALIGLLLQQGASMDSFQKQPLLHASIKKMRTKLFKEQRVESIDLGMKVASQEVEVAAIGYRLRYRYYDKNHVTSSQIRSAGLAETHPQMKSALLAGAASWEKAEKYQGNDREYAVKLSIFRMTYATRDAGIVEFLSEFEAKHGNIQKVKKGEYVEYRAVGDRLPYKFLTNPKYLKPYN